MSNKALIILAHGSRSHSANSFFLELIRIVRQECGNDNIAGAFFSLAEPSLESTVEQLAQWHVKKIFVFPYFLVNGTHVLQDIPEMIRMLEDRYPRIQFKILDSLESEPLMSSILSAKVRQFLA